MENLIGTLWLHIHAMMDTPLQDQRLEGVHQQDQMSLGMETHLIVNKAITD